MTNTPPSIQLSAAFSPWILAIALLASVAFAIWSYQRTNPPISQFMRWTLTFLRSVGLIGGVLLLAQPLLQISRERSEPPLVALLLDRSTSMSLKQGGIDRGQQLAELFSSTALKQFEERHHVVNFQFSDTLIKSDEDQRALPPANGPATDIATSLGTLTPALNKQTPEAILLISDGANNRGADPARLARTGRTPIYAIGIGSTEPSRDLMITEVVSNPVVYQGSKTPVEVGYSAVGLSGTTFEVLLRNEKGEVVGRERVTATSDYIEGTAHFETVVEKAGRIQYRVEIPVLEGELTADNNRRAFYLNALANKMRVLVMAGMPDNSLGDLVRRLNSDDQIELTLRTSKGANFYEGSWPDDALLDRVDVLILHHFPSRKNSSAQLEGFANAIAKRKLPICLIDGGDLDMTLLRYFGDLLPVKYSGDDGEIRSATIKPLRRHSIIAEPDDEEFAQKWTSLPPLKFLSGTFELQSGAEVLAEFEEGAGRHSPALIVMEKGASKSAALMTRDMWRWGLASPGKDGVTEPLMSRLVRWLAVRKSEKRVQLAFAKEQFTLQEPLGLTVSVYDENYKPLDKADVMVKVTAVGRDGTQLGLQGVGGGQYRGSFQPWGEGEYKVSVQATLDGRNLGSDSGSVIVEPFSIELLNTRMNEPLLVSIAEASGGMYAPASVADRMLDSLTIPATITHHERRIALSGGWIHLALVIGCLALEWFLRVRQGML